jgi:putative membrane protein
MMWYGSDMSGWGYAFMAVGSILFWALLIAAILALVRFTGRGQGDSAAPHVPEEILAERFAGGEIDEDEYHRKLEVLRRSGSPLTRF